MTAQDTDALGLTYLIDRSNSDDDFFQGYCFHGSHMIFGADGAAEYSDEAGLSVPASEDGAYIAMARAGASRVFYSDFSGFKKIFYYWKDGIWAVSNSIPELVHHMTANNVAAKIRPHRLIGTTTPRTFFCQLTSCETLVEGIRALPVNHVLDISQDRARTYPQTMPAPVGSYRERLSGAVELWLSRMETLLSHPQLTVRSDLTGGLDSRTVLALLLKAEGRLGTDKRAALMFRCAASERTVDDIAVAGALSEKFGFPFNVADDNRRRLSPAQSYASWKHLCLGSYFPIYFPSLGASAYDVSLAGIGGENHRPFYSKYFGTDDEAKALPLILKPLPEGDARDLLQREIAASFADTVANSADEAPSALRQHYRAYRNRFHGGRQPQCCTTFAPLASRYFEDAVRSAPHEMIECGQMQYDVIESLVPGLAYEPYDTDSKSPTQSIASRLAQMDVRGAANPGRLYAPSSTEVAANQKGDRTTLDMLNEDFELAAHRPEVQHTWGSDVIASCRETLAEAVGRGRLGHAMDGRVISAVIATGLAPCDPADTPGAASMDGLGDALRPPLLWSRANRPPTAGPDGLGKVVSAGMSMRTELQVTTVDLRRQPVAAIADEVRKQYEAKFGTNPENPGGWLRPDDWLRLSYVFDLLEPGGSVLDVGLGAGQFVNMLAASGGFSSVHGADPTRFNKYTEFYPGIDAGRHSVGELPFADGQFDVVTCMEVLEHVPDDVFQAGLGELRRVCRGQLIMSVPFQEPEPISKTHVRRFESEDIRRVFPNGRYILLDRPRMPWMLIEEMPVALLFAQREELTRLRPRLERLESDLARLRARRALRIANWVGRQRRRLRP